MVGKEFYDEIPQTTASEVYCMIYCVCVYIDGLASLHYILEKPPR